MRRLHGRWECHRSLVWVLALQGGRTLAHHRSIALPQSPGDRAENRMSTVPERFRHLEDPLRELDRPQ